MLLTIIIIVVYKHQLIRIACLWPYVCRSRWIPYAARLKLCGPSGTLMRGWSSRKLTRFCSSLGRHWHREVCMMIRAHHDIHIIAVVSHIPFNHYHSNTILLLWYIVYGTIPPLMAGRHTGKLHLQANIIIIILLYHAHIDNETIKTSLCIKHSSILILLIFLLNKTWFYIFINNYYYRIKYYSIF